MDKQNAVLTHDEVKEVLTQATTWMNLEDIVLRKAVQKDVFCTIP